jgi:elongation factor Ts
MIKELREATGAGVLDTKKALEASEGDFAEAARLLREKGLVRAAKRSGRQTTEGRIEARSEGGRVGLLVEVNCETDFVGRNQAFVAFASGLADHFFALADEEQTLDQLMARPFVTDPSTSPAELLQNQISITGENIAVRRFVRFELGDRPGVIEVYLHPGNRVGVMIELDSETAAGAAEESFAGTAHDLALHIAACAPMCLTREEMSGERLDAETEIYRTQALALGKPEPIVERIVQGRLKKYFEDVVLFEQPFVKDDEVNVGELLKQRAAELGEEITVRCFARYELGESLD